ncbi:MAG: hypothetical protein IBX43_05165 [Campylobacterales bacterium]|nr:hypothetical protein [Campylobacterales bacterium]
MGKYFTTEDLMEHCKDEAEYGRLTAFLYGKIGTAKDKDGYELSKMLTVTRGERVIKKAFCLYSFKHAAQTIDKMIERGNGRMAKHFGAWTRYKEILLEVQA